MLRAEFDKFSRREVLIVRVRQLPPPKENGYAESRGPILSENFSEEYLRPCEGIRKRLAPGLLAQMSGFHFNAIPKPRQASSALNGSATGNSGHSGF